MAVAYLPDGTPLYIKAARGNTKSTLQIEIYKKLLGLKEEHMAKCATCENAIFDAKYGDYKCSIKEHYIYDHESMVDCKDHKNGTPKESKANADYETEMS
jgi:hypothetical protein